MTICIQTECEAHTIALAAKLGSRLESGDVIALYGLLGSGKTCFVRGLAKGMDLDPRAVVSPTFVIHQEYQGEGTLTLVHIDAYRLQGPPELETIGWEELLTARKTVIAVEWAARIASALPTMRIDVSLEHRGERTRRVTITAPSLLAERLAALRDIQTTRPCPTCGAEAAWWSEMAPFCSQRCRLADLGQWFDESFRISRPVSESDEP
jgi:tRNA threonylcarbamoyladenosine biosynthesis protein TsaE